MDHHVQARLGDLGDLGDPGDAESFLRHLAPLQGVLEAYCRRALRNPSDVPDVLQAAIAYAFRDFDLYASGSNFRAWIFRYVHLESCNRNRQEARHRHEPLPDELPIEETWDAILNEPLLEVLLDDPAIVLDKCEDELAGAVLSLPALERAVFLLRALGEFKYREIADILSVPIGTVMGTLARSRMRLRQRLVEFGEERGLLQREGGAP